MIVDAVGVTETELVETQPLDRKPTVPLDKLLRQLSWGVRDPDSLSTIAARLSRLDRRLTKDDRDQLEQLVRRHDPQGDRERDRRCARPRPATRSSTSRHGERRPRPSRRSRCASRSLLDAAIEPLATQPRAP